jgi:ferrous iron transport protein B
MKTIALAGNPNSGKSSLFNQLTGLRQKVANFPGVTVEKKTGICRLDQQEVLVVDLPGAYSLYPNSSDEQVVLNILANPGDENYPDALVYVADQTHLEKHFLLLTQILDLGIPCVLGLNMADLAEKQGTCVEAAELSRLLNIPVVNFSARLGTNLESLKAEMAGLLASPPPARREPFHSPSEAEARIISRIQQELGVANPYHALLLAHHAERCPFLSPENKQRLAGICQEAKFQHTRQQIAETLKRYERFTPLLRQCLMENQESVTLTDRVDKVLTHRIWAPVIFFALMFLVFQAVFTWAEAPMNWIEQGFGSLANYVKETMPDGWIARLLADGIIAGLGGIVVFVPQISILFLIITILEEIGYMSRAAFISDRLMQHFGLNGRSVIALVSGGACAIPAIMSTRTISNWKERLITILVTPFISCSARIPVYAVLIGFVVPPTQLGIFNLQGLAFMGLYLLGIAAALASAWIFKKILRSGDPSWLMLELPPYRWPVWRNVWLTVYEKVSSFVLEAGKVILLISVVLWALASFGPGEGMARASEEAALQANRQNLGEAQASDLEAALRMEASYAGYLGKVMEPFIEPLGFDWKIGIALLTSFAAREVFVGTMATLYSIGSTDEEATIKEQMAKAVHPKTGLKVYTPATSLSLLVFYVFALQCMSTLAVVKRETGSWKWPLLQFLFMGALAYLGSLAAYQMLS